MPDRYVEPDVIYGHSPDRTPEFWVAVCSDDARIPAVLERHHFHPTRIDDLILFVPDPQADTQLRTVWHLDSYTELHSLGLVVMSTENHPALPDARLDALLALPHAPAPAPSTTTTNTPRRSR
ncbi:hypothetical protein AB0J38_25170 [Streptomyces sp. NPDC050095]|uniref:hypothetical protein n=1 Tax=unclassified Streptomyces TaxID=2593676 RepID=UPI00344340AA